MTAEKEKNIALINQGTEVSSRNCQSVNNNNNNNNNNNIY